MIKIDKRKAIELLEAAVAERGADYVYGEHFNYCEYTVNEDGVRVSACVVGVAMEKVGVPLAVMATIDGPVDFLAFDLKSCGIAKFSSKAVEVFQAAQKVQDASKTGVIYHDDAEGDPVVKAEQTWGKALEAAKAVAGV